MAGDSVQEVRCDPAGQPLARVFKTISDPYVGKISLLRVLSGTIRSDSVLTNSRTHSDERLHVLEQLRGKEAHAAERGPGRGHRGRAQARRRRHRRHPGAQGGPGGRPAPARPSRWPCPSPSGPSPEGDEDKLMIGLHRLQEEDPALVVERVDETHQTILRGTGETHLAMAVERLARKFGVEIVTEDVLIPYRETITRSSRGGGQVQEADRWSRPVRRGVDPHRAPRARARVSSSSIRSSAGPSRRQYIPAVEKGIIEAMGHGGLHGYPVVDVRVTCLDGKHHAVDSSEMSFKMAGSLAFKEAMAKAGPGPARTRLAARGDRARHHAGSRPRGPERSAGTGAGHRRPWPPDVQRITALVPTAEIQRYAVDLRSLTAGRGRFRAEHDHYDVVPTNLVDRVTKAAAG